jgi:hypothetical protein
MVYHHVLWEATFNLSVVCLFDWVVPWKDKIIQFILTKIKQADTWCTTWFSGKIQQTNIVYFFDWVVSWKDKTSHFSRAKIEQANTRCTPGSAVRSNKPISCTCLTRKCRGKIKSANLFAIRSNMPIHGVLPGFAVRSDKLIQGPPLFTAVGSPLPF